MIIGFGAWQARRGWDGGGVQSLFEEWNGKYREYGGQPFKYFRELRLLILRWRAFIPSIGSTRLLWIRIISRVGPSILSSWRRGEPHFGPPASAKLFTLLFPKSKIHSRPQRPPHTNDFYLRIGSLSSSLLNMRKIFLSMSMVMVCVKNVLHSGISTYGIMWTLSVSEFGHKTSATSL